MFQFSINCCLVFFAGNKSSSATGRRGKAFRTNNSRNRIFPPPPNVQETNFDCANYEFPGLYADTEANCEVSDIIFSDGFRSNFPKPGFLAARYPSLKYTTIFQHPKMRDESLRKVIQIDAEGKQIVVFKCEHCEKPHFTPAALSCK